MTSHEVPVRQPAQQQGSGQRDRLLTREIITLAAVVVLGSIMTILDATIVNVALPTLGREFGTSISVIQWVPTIYLLAFASVIPLTGWASERFGAKRVWLASLAAFMLGSLLCALSGSVAELIVFRVLQGLGGGMIMPVGQAILARAAGPARIGRVMSIVGVPLLLGPIVGPVIGGAIVSGTSWRWIFLVNLPVGAVALALALWLLRPARATRLTWTCAAWCWPPAASPHWSTGLAGWPPAAPARTRCHSLPGSPGWPCWHRSVSMRSGRRTR